MKKHMLVMATALTLLSAPPLFAETAAEIEPHAATTVEGFRSATFGMTEADVRSAITKDFKLKADAITPSDNAVEETHALAIKVMDLLPNGGQSKVSYIFGAKTHKLIEINVTWAPTTDPAITPSMLTRNAELLASYFHSGGFRPDAVQTNLLLNNGSLMLFRGSDAKDHMVILILESEPAADKAEPSKRNPKSLLISYISDPKNPDIFKLPAGSF
jgi:hypothetical protein